MVAVTGGGVEALRRTHEVRERLRDGLGEVLGG
jgi:hypothetical protein